MGVMHANPRNYRPNVNKIQLEGACFAHEGQILADLYNSETNQFIRTAVVADVGASGLGRAIQYCIEANKK